MSLIKNCEVCKNSYTKKSRQAYWQFEVSRFCSKSCKGKTQGFKRKAPQEKNCTYCGIKYYRYGKQKIEWWRGSRYCSQLCYQTQRSLKAVRHIYRGTQNKKWRKQVLERDNYKCRISNHQCKGSLEVHHILRYTLYPELRYEVRNGITLCHAHHPRKKVEEENLVSKFQELTYDDCR